MTPKARILPGKLSTPGLRAAVAATPAGFPKQELKAECPEGLCRVSVEWGSRAIT